MSESERIVTLGRRAQARGEQLCLATVVHVEGSAYRKPGARMLVTSGGERAGTISGGCLESEISRKAWWLTAGGARVERYSSFADEDGGMPYGLGCGGVVWLLLEQGEAVEAVLAALEHVLATREPAVVAVALRHGLPGAASGSARRPWSVGQSQLEQSHTERNLEVHEPDPATQRLHQGTPEGTAGAAVGTLGVWTLPSASAGSSQPLTPEQCALKATYRREGLVEELAWASSGESSRWSTLEHAARVAVAQRRSCLLTESLSPYRAEAYSSGEHADAPAYWVEYLPAPPALSIFGAGDDAQPIAELAHALGWRVTVADGRAHLARRERFPTAAEVRVLDYADPALRAACGMARLSARAASGRLAMPMQRSDETPEPLDPAGHNLLSARHNLLPGEAAGLASDEIAVVLTHSYEQDRALLTALLPRELRYLGILGPRHRTEQLLGEVAPPLGLTVAQGFERLHSPIGLDLGAEDPSAVALSIVAEIQAVLHGRQVEVRRTEPAQALSGVAFLDEDSLTAACG